MHSPSLKSSVFPKPAFVVYTPKPQAETHVNPITPETPVSHPPHPHPHPSYSTPSPPPPASQLSAPPSVSPAASRLPRRLDARATGGRSWRKGRQRRRVRISGSRVFEGLRLRLRLGAALSWWMWMGLKKFESMVVYLSWAWWRRGGEILGVEERARGRWRV